MLILVISNPSIHLDQLISLSPNGAVHASSQEYHAACYPVKLVEEIKAQATETGIGKRGYVELLKVDVHRIESCDHNRAKPAREIGKREVIIQLTRQGHRQDVG